MYKIKKSMKMPTILTILIADIENMDKKYTPTHTNALSLIEFLFFLYF